MKHWDVQIRQLAAQSLSVLSVFNPDYIVEKILTPLLKSCFSKALHVRHGAILGVSEIIIGLSGNSVIHRQQVLEKAFKTLSLKERNLIKEETENQKKFKVFYDEISTKNCLQTNLPEGSSQLSSIKTLVDEIEKQRLYRGKGGEIMRAGVCHFIHSLSQAQIQLEGADLSQLFQTLKENFRHPNFEIQQESTKAFKSFCLAYFNNSSEEQLPEDRKFITSEVQKLYTCSMKDDNIAVTRGYNMAFGVLSPQLLQLLNVELIETLLKNCIAKGRESDDAETRREATKSLINVVKTLGIKNIDSDQLVDILETMYEALNDYALDRRGDVGSWVREQTMRSLLQFVETLLDENATADNLHAIQKLGADKAPFYERFVGSLLQQLVEKIDRVRESAGRQLQFFFKFHAKNVCDFASKDHLTALFISEEKQLPSTTTISAASDGKGGALETHQHDEGIGYLPWRSAEFVFEHIQPFFDAEVYSL